MKTILVTGGAGYIGSHCVQELINNDYKVIVYDNLIYGHKEAVSDKAIFIEGDLSDTTKLDSIFKQHNIDAVMHFAAYAYVGESIENPRKYFNNNYANGLNLLNTMIDNNVKNIIFSSTCAIFGQPKQMPITEDLPKNSINPYGLSKLMFEKTLEWYDKAYELKHVCLRYFNAAGAAYGLGEHHDPETHLIPLVLEAALGKRDSIKVWGNDYPTLDGTCIRDYIHVKDLAKAHVMTLDLKDSDVFNLGIGKGYSVLEVIEAARQVTGKEIKISIDSRRPGDPAVLISGNAKITRELNWKPEFSSLKEIIATAWEWHKEHLNGYEGAEI